MNTPQVQAMNFMINLGNDVAEKESYRIDEFREDFSTFLEERMDRWELGLVMLYFHHFMQSFMEEAKQPAIHIEEDDKFQHQVAKPYLQMAWAIVCELMYDEPRPLMYT